jgi:hypothetical protein
MVVLHPPLLLWDEWLRGRSRSERAGATTQHSSGNRSNVLSSYALVLRDLADVAALARFVQASQKLSHGRIKVVFAAVFSTTHSHL